MEAVGNRREYLFRFGMNEPRNENDWDVVLRVGELTLEQNLGSLEQRSMRYLRGATVGLVFAMLEGILFSIEGDQNSPNDTTRVLDSMARPFLYSFGCALVNVYRHVGIRAFRILQR